ncbi:MFS-type transporter SLC18B1, partial [Orchesella cincta]
MVFSAENMPSQKVDCCGETTFIGISGRNQNVDEKRDRNVLTDSPSSSRSLQSSDESIGTNSTCEAVDASENPSRSCRSNISSRTSSIEDSDTKNVKCDSSLEFSYTLGNSDAIHSCDSKTNFPVCKSQPNGDTQEKHKRKNFIVQYFKRKSQGWNRRQFLIILILSFVEFFASAVISIQAPFYPDVARQKGATASEYGLVFGIFEATVFIMSPIYGAKMGSLGPTRVFNWGIFTTGFCCIIFG